jgi:hypothetical protein
MENEARTRRGNGRGGDIKRTRKNKEVLKKEEYKDSG